MDRDFKGVNQVILIVLDSVGIGGAPDADTFGDIGSNTLGNTAKVVGGLQIPNLASLGLGHLGEFKGVPAVDQPLGAYGILTEVSAGKDTTTGHWELSGLILDDPFPTFPDGFPQEFIQEFERSIGRETLGNVPASGTEIIDRLGREHLETGKPIVYTSADSVFQVAAHEEVIPVDELYRICEVARELLTDDLAVGRVIARPFLGSPGNFRRTERRKDFSLLPPGSTILDHLCAAGLMVAGVGKIEDIFAGRGLSASKHTDGNDAGVDAILEYIKTREPGLIFANLVDFDSQYGHRNDPEGYAKALEAFDARLPELMQVMTDNDILFITADHGNDPTTPSTDHSREQVPLLAVGKPVSQGVFLGIRTSFSDLAATIASVLEVEWYGPGHDFSKLLLRQDIGR